MIPPAEEAHLFMEFGNGESEFVALIDGGAQLNVLSEQLLLDGAMSYYEADGPFDQCRWGAGPRCRISRWILLPIVMSNGRRTLARMAVLRGIRGMIILGRPFLKSQKAKVDHFASTLDTPDGPIPLLEGFCSSRSMNMMGKVDDEGRDANSEVTSGLPVKFDGDPQSMVDQLSPEDRIRLTDKITAARVGEPYQVQLRNMLLKYSDLWKGKIRGVCTQGEHGIQLTHDYPIITKPRRHTAEQNEAIVKEVQQMLKDKVIRPSSSPYVSEVVMVKKPDGSWRVCVDFRRINAATVSDKYPLPRLGDLLKAVKGSRHFVALDQRWGYWQIPLEDAACRYTAFRCPVGLFEFIVMPFGLVNAPATFQRIMDNLFKDLRYKGVLAYLDDLLIHGDDVGDVLQRLEVVLARMFQAGLRLNLEKCVFFPAVLKYLGHLFSDGKMYPNPKRTQLLRDAHRPKNICELRSLIGTLTYYSSYVPQFARWAAPLNDLLVGRVKRKDLRPIEWTQRHEDSLTKIKTLLADTCLTIPIDSDEYLMETDASDHGVAAVVSVRRDDKWCPVEFASKKFNNTQKRWPVREKEAFGIIFGLQKFDYLLRGRSFTVHTDHQSLQWIMDAKAGKLSRWACLISEYDMQVMWKKGDSLLHIDYFSRYGEDPDPVQDHMVYTVWAGPHKSLDCQIQLPTLGDVVKAQLNSSLPHGRGFTLREGALYYMGRLWVPPQLRQSVIAACHLAAPLHHPRVQKTENLVKRAFNWPNLHDDVFCFVRSCLSCQRFGIAAEHRKGLFKTHPVPGPFHTLYMDYFSAPYGAKKYDILTMIDQHTKWAEAVIVPDHTKEVLTSAFMTSWVVRFGVPRVVIHDGEGSLISDLFNRLVKRLGCKPVTITPHHPEGNAPIESFHRSLKRALTDFNSQDDRLPMEEALALSLLAYRTTVHQSTHETPAFLAYGVDLVPPVEGDWRFATSTEEKNRINFLNALRLDIQYQVYKRRAKANATTNEGRLDVSFTLNDLVLCRQQFFSKNEAHHRHFPQGKKLVPAWGLPCRVVKVFDGKKSALVRSLLSGKVRHVHIQDARFIEAPKCRELQKDWDKQLLTEVDNMYDPATRKEILSKFWQEVHCPQQNENTPSEIGQKRRRTRSGFGGA